WTLEMPPPPDSGESYDAVVVFGGLYDDAATLTWGRPAYTDAVERMLVGFDLWRAGRARVVVFSGANVPGGPGRPSEAEALATQLERWGTPHDALVVEGESRNTHENAAFVAKIARERGWTKIALVTSAAHMKRAAGCMRAEGIEVAPIPV